MRKPRIIVPGFPHHVILRGNNRRRLFSYPSDYWAFTRYLEDGLQKHACLMHALVLMTNHVHLLMTPAGLDDLPKLVHVMSMRYAQLRNRKHADTGKLFESRFTSFPVVGEGQLAIVTAYIELNPVRAGMREDPFDYPYSTHALHAASAVRAVPSRLWTPTDWYLSLGPSEVERTVRYREWVAACHSQGREPERVKLINWLEAVSNRGSDRRLRRPNEKRAS